MERGIELHEQKAKQIIKEVEAPGSTTKVSNLNKLKEIAKDGRKAYESKKSGGKLRGMGKALRGGGKVMRG